MHIQMMKSRKTDTSENSRRVQCNMKGTLTESLAQYWKGTLVGVQKLLDVGEAISVDSKTSSYHSVLKGNVIK